ncbi:MAG: DUF2277 domain-containing protein [Austwickia sp.]|nr:DUF2277 domain-containing protein [Austwickia sp.]MBK8435256.1 DUF2277 domain-containing protein [Austwickia sp.]MBK9101192.1 DUF2277 domain-containing protein [Austwickia sp.]
MCRNIRPLNNLAPPATEDEVHEAALQYVRKIAGTRTPSAANQQAFDDAVQRITAASQDLLQALTTTAPPRTREHLADSARARAAKRFG